VSRRWTCGRCAVIVSYGPEADVPTRPDGWVRDNGAWRCLRCRREDAMDEASSASTAEGRADRRRALLAFEIDRDPAAPDRVIAKRARCPTAAVRGVRTALSKEQDG